MTIDRDAVRVMRFAPLPSPHFTTHHSPLLRPLLRPPCLRANLITMLDTRASSRSTSVRRSLPRIVNPLVLVALVYTNARVYGSVRFHATTEERIVGNRRNGVGQRTTTHDIDTPTTLRAAHTTIHTHTRTIVGLRAAIVSVSRYS